MKKIININFHSRVVPIEETAYEILQQYIDSLRRYFANEDGRDEIISDIENRFAELFSENLKKGSACITDADVNTIIASMGRPEDFEDEELAGAPNAGSGTNANSGYAGSAAGAGQAAGQQGTYEYTEPRRLYRADNDKILGGVCAGLANYLRIDPAILRIIFVLTTLTGGVGFLLYIVMWIVLPTKSLPANIRKRLYRNSDDRVIGGVASGLAAYFHIEVWIPRLIFALPLILAVITGILGNAFWHFHGRNFFAGGFGGTLFVTYIVLWIVLPEAVTASEKLEMRGEKVDLASIKNTIKSDLEGFNKKAREVGAEMKESFSQAGKRMKEGTQNFASEAGPIVRKTNSGIAHAVGVLFKAFFLCIAGIIAFALIMALAALVFRGGGVLHIKDYFLSGVGENFLAWTGFLLFFVIPVVALLTWLIRRIAGLRSRRHYLGYIFATLWVIGLFCLIGLGGMVMNDFNSKQHVEDPFSISQPSHGKMVILADKTDSRSFYDFDSDWWSDGDWGNHGPFYKMNEDSVLLSTVKVTLLKSEDSSYHVRVLRFSRGDNAHNAHELAQQISFPISQNDSILHLPSGFTITRHEKFRNQQVVIAVEVPVGKRIVINNSVHEYHWFSINNHGRRVSWNTSTNDDWGHDYDDDLNLQPSFYWNSNVEYIMTAEGLTRTDHQGNPEKKDRVRNNRMNQDDNNDNEEQPERPEATERPERKERPELKEKSGDYRYKGPVEHPKTKARSDSAVQKSTTMLSVGGNIELPLLSALYTY